MKAPPRVERRQRERERENEGRKEGKEGVDVAQREFFSFPASVSWDVERARIFLLASTEDQTSHFISVPSTPVEALSTPQPPSRHRFPPLSHSLPPLSLSIHVSYGWSRIGGAPPAAPRVTLSGGEPFVIHQRTKRGEELVFLYPRCPCLIGCKPFASLFTIFEGVSNGDQSCFELSLLARFSELGCANTVPFSLQWNVKGRKVYLSVLTVEY